MMKSVDEDSEASASPASSAETLARIAELLGCPVEALTDDAHDRRNMKGASELLTIWVEIDDDASRERLLELARKLAKA